MARIIAEAYRNCIIRGIRVIDDVRPDELKREVQEFLVEAGRADLAGIEEDVVEEVPEEEVVEEAQEDEAPTDSTEEKEEPIKDDESKEDKEG